MTSETEALRPAWRFFLEHAGWSVPPGRAACALEMARTERTLRRAQGLGVAAIQWLDDPEPWQGLFEPVGDVMGCVLWIGAELELRTDGRDPDGWTDNTSLWGIDGVSRYDAPYRRVIEAELASELEDELRQAIGDALDTRAAASRTACRLAAGIQAIA